MISTALIVKIALVLGALGAFGAAKYYFRMADDNVIEEYAEQIIEQQTGLAVDLTPCSSESST